MMTPHGKVIVKHADESTKLLEGFRLGQGKNRLDTFEPWLQASWCHPVTEKFGFLNAPLTFERVDREAVIM